MNNRLTNTNCDTRNQALYFSGRTVIFYHKLCTSLQFFDFLYGGRRHLGFSKFQIFNGRKGRESRTASALFVDGPNTRKTNPRWRTAVILRNRKLVISPQRFDRSSRNLVRWRHWASEPDRKWKFPTFKNPS